MQTYTDEWLVVSSNAVNNVQDMTAVAAHFESICSTFKDNPNLKHIKNIIVQSDGAACYQNVQLKLIAWFIAKKYGLNLERYIHTGVQDGKGQLDAHFATSMKHVMRHVVEGNNTVSPAQLVLSLSSNGGLRRTTVLLVEKNKARTIEFLKQYSEVSKQMKTVNKLTKDAECQYITSPSNDGGDVSLTSIKFVRYSGVSEPFEVAVQSNDVSRDPIGNGDVQMATADNAEDREMLVDAVAGDESEMEDDEEGANDEDENLTDENEDVTDEDEQMTDEDEEIDGDNDMDDDSSGDDDGSDVNGGQGAAVPSNNDDEDEDEKDGNSDTLSGVKILSTQRVNELAKRWVRRRARERLSDLDQSSDEDGDSNNGPRSSILQCRECK